MKLNRNTKQITVVAGNKPYLLVIHRTGSYTRGFSKETRRDYLILTLSGRMIAKITDDGKRAIVTGATGTMRKHYIALGVSNVVCDTVPEAFAKFVQKDLHMAFVCTR